MRTAIVFACLAALPIWSYGSDDAGPAAEPAQEQAPPVAQSPKATIPTPPPASDAKPSKEAESDSVKPPAKGPEAESAKPPAKGIETDPTKMAAPATEPVIPQGVGAANERTYEIGPEDVLGIVVWGNAALTHPALVRSDGRITVALIGEVTAAGKTPEQLSQEIADRLKSGGFLLNPRVTVGVSQINSKNFFIQGEINKPGRYSLIVPMTVLEALVNAGGFRDFANKKDIRIIRGDKQYKFNYNQVIKGKNRDQNIQVRPGDLIVVK